MKKIIIFIVIVLFLISGCSITITFSGFGINTNYDLMEQELSPELIGFDGRLGLENILSYESSVSKTGFYINGNLAYENDKLGILQDSLIINDTLYLAFDGKGVLSLDLNNPDFKKMENNIRDREYSQTMKLVSNGKNVYYLNNSQICRFDKDQKETCTEYYKEGNVTDVLELYKGNLYVSIFDSSGDTAKSKFLTINPETLKVSSSSDLNFGVSNSAVVDDILYIDTGEEFGVYDNGKVSINNMNNYVYNSNTSYDEDEVSGILKLKTVGDKLLIESNEGKIFSVDPKQNHKVTELLESGHIISVNENEAYITDLTWEEDKNILKYDSKTNKAEYIDYVEGNNSEMYLFY